VPGIGAGTWYSSLRLRASHVGLEFVFLSPA
jgi:hypothetical protein